MGKISVFELQAMAIMDPSRTPNFMAWTQDLTTDLRSMKLFPMFDHYPKEATPLYFASSFGLIDVVKHLLENGVEVDAIGGSFGGTALHAASWRDHPEIVRTLLEAGADTLIEDVNDMTAYDLTQYTRNKKLIDVLKMFAASSGEI